MAHELDITHGQASFATARIPAWHQLGTVMPTTMTGQQALEAARLAHWNVRLLPIHGTDTTLDGVTSVAADDRRMSVRTNPVTGNTDYLGIVSHNYHVIQNEECADILDHLVDESGAHIETAGALRGGRSVFITMRLPDTMMVAGTDRLDLYLVITSSHDGSAAIRIDATPIRVVCANTQKAALRNSVAHYRFQHTPSAKGKIQHARQALGLTWKYFDTFQAHAETMIDQQLDMDTFTAITQKLWPIDHDASPRTKNRAAQRDATLGWLFRDADTQHGFHHTTWGGYQAIVEYIDHYAPATTHDIRATRAVTGTGPALKEKAFALLTS